MAVVGAGVVLANAALLLSDRAPRVLRSLFGDFADRLSDRIDGSGRSRAALGAREVGSDSIVHFGLWAAAIVLFGIAVWRWSALAVSAITVFACSVAIEVGQGRYSTTRSVEFRDVLFNGLGVAAGTVAVAALHDSAAAAARAFHGRARRAEQRMERDGGAGRRQEKNPA